MSWLRARLAERSTWIGLALAIAAGVACHAWHVNPLHWIGEALGAGLAFAIRDSTFAELGRRLAGAVIETVLDDLPQAAPGQARGSPMSIFDVVKRLQRYEPVLPQAGAALKAGEAFAATGTVAAFGAFAESVFELVEAVDALPAGTVAASTQPPAVAS